MRILYVLKHNPWGIGGGCYACRNYLQLFSTMFADDKIDACICEEYLQKGNPSDFLNVNFIPVRQRSQLGKLMTIFSGVMHRHQHAVKELLEENHYDYCIFDHNCMAGSLVMDCKRKGIKTIVLNHNCEHDYFRDNNGVLKRLLFLRHVVANERRSYLNCDLNIFLTEEDKAQFAEMYGTSNTQLFVGGCFYSKDYAFVSSVSVGTFRKEHMKLVISGTMGNVQNLDGINYFLDELLPHVPADMEVMLAGKNPPISLLERIKPMSPRVIVIPNPKDMDSIVRDCDIFLCPARLGGGMKLRVMDGFRNGLPVLTHSVSARGYREFEKKGMMWEFDTVEVFRQNLQQVLQDIKDGKISREQIRKEACRMFAFEHAVERMKKMIRK